MTEIKMRTSLIVLLLLIIIAGIIYYFNFYPRESTMEGTLVKNEINFEYEDSAQHSGGL
ncbi:MAG: hypothetical protein GX913_04115 [Clostridiales bacterium]|nr:hypothetical protein [Clostridiales bacterium]